MANLISSDEQLFGGGVAPAPTRNLGGGGSLIGSDEDLFGLSAMPAAAPKRTALGTLGDVANVAAKGVIGVGEGVVGLANIPTFGYAGKAMESIGYDPKRSREILNDLLQSDAQKAAQQEVDAAEGFTGTVKTALENPSTILTAAGESLPSMFAGGAIAKGLKGLTNLGGFARAAIGEGAISGGQTAEQIRQQTEDGTLSLGQTAIAVGSGALTGLLGYAGGKLARRLGIDDIDAVVAGVNASGAAAKRGLATRVLGAAVQEGVIEELPQSAQEQIAQNIALDRPWDEGVDKAAAMGMLAGAATGGGFQLMPQGRSDQPRQSGRSAEFVSQAFTDVGGAGQTMDELGRAKGAVAFALANLNDDEAGQIISSVSSGNEQLMQQLSAARADAALISSGRQFAQDNPIQFAAVSDMLRVDSGLNEADPSDSTSALISQELSRAFPSIYQQQTQQGQQPQPPQQPAVDPAGVTNTAGFIPEPLEQIQAQITAVTEGRKPAVVVGIQEAQNANFGGLSTGIATDPNTGEQAVVAAADDATVQAAVTRTAEVGLAQAMGEVLGYTQPGLTQQQVPAAVVQQVDNNSGQILSEEAVTPEAAASVNRVPGTTARVVTPEQALQSRMERTSTAVVQPELASTEPDSVVSPVAQEQNAVPADTTAVLPEPTAVNWAATGRTSGLVSLLNRSNGLQDGSPNSIDPSSVREVDIRSVKDRKQRRQLGQLAKAAKLAFGVDLILVDTPAGAVKRMDGSDFNQFNGVALPESKQLFLNVRAATPLNTLGHELAHILEVQAAETYARLEDTILTRVRFGAAKRLQTALQQAVQAESQGAVDINQRVAELRSELIAESIGELTADPKLWRDIFQGMGTDSAQVKSLYDTVIEAVGRLAKAFTRVGYIDGLKDMQAVRRAITDAYVSWSAAQQGAAPAQVSAQSSAPPPREAARFDRLPQKRFSPDNFPVTLTDDDPLLRETITISGRARQDLRRGIVDQHFQSTSPNQYGRPILFLMGGGGGAGKTTAMAKLAGAGVIPDTSTAVTVNADEIKEMIPEFGKIKSVGDWRAAVTVHEESSLLTKAVQLRAMGAAADQVEESLKPYLPTASSGKYNLVIDGTMADERKGLRLISDAVDRGYHVVMMGVITKPSDAVARAKSRGERSGRFVPNDILFNAHAGFLSVLQAYSNVLGTNLHLVDNSGPQPVMTAFDDAAKEKIREYIADAGRGAEEIRASRSGRAAEPAAGQPKSGAQELQQRTTRGLPEATARDAAQGGREGQGQSADGLARGVVKLSRANIQRAASGDQSASAMEVMGKAPDYLARVGINREAPLVIEADVIYKVATGKGYTGTEKRTPLTVDQIQQLPQLLRNPAAVFDDPTDKNSVVVMTSLVVDQFDPVVIAISKDAKSNRVDIVRVSGSIEMNKGAYSPIKTAFGKEWDKFESWMRKENVLRYINPKNIDAAVQAGMPKRLARSLREAQILSKGRAYVEGGTASLAQIAYSPQQREVASGSNPGSLRQAPPASIVALPAGSVNPASGRKVLGKKVLAQRVLDRNPIYDALPENLRSASVVEPLYRNGPLFAFPSNAGKINTRIGAYLEERTKKALGRELDVADPEDQKLVAKMAAAEAVEAMIRDENASEWYDETMVKAFELAALVHPEIKTDPRAKNAFALVTAITSQGLNVEDNMASSLEIYEQWVASSNDANKRSFPERGVGKSSGAMANNFKKANRLIDEMGWDEFISFMNSSYSNRFMEKVFRGNVGGEGQDNIVYGSGIFGAKIGNGFFQNLMGNFKPITMDMWFSRTIGRLSGRVRAFTNELMADQLEKLRAAFVEGGDATRSLQPESFGDLIDEDLFLSDDDYAMGIAEEIRLAHEKDYKANRAGFDNRTRFKSALVNAAEAVSDTLYGLRDSPEGAAHRDQLRQISLMAIEEIRQSTGVNVEPAAFQALIWYPEQRLYRKMGGKQRVVGQDYVGAITKELLRRGVGIEEIEATKRAVSEQLRASRTRPQGEGDAGGRPESGQDGAAGTRSNEGRVVQESAQEFSGQNLIFEVAPDPGNQALTAAWNSLPADKRLKISQKLAKRYSKRVLSALGMTGEMVSQIGGYMDFTNPSLTIRLGKGGDPVLAAGMLGHVLSQDSMVVISETSFKGGELTGAVEIDVPADITLEQADKLYQELRKIKGADGNSLVGGHTTASGKMAILNYSGLSNEELASRIDRHLAGGYTVRYRDVFVSFPEKQDYNYAGDQRDRPTAARRPSFQGDANRLRAAASSDIEAELRSAGVKFSRTQGVARLAEPAGGPGTGGDQGPGSVRGAVHYGRSGFLSQLTGSAFGSGIRGAEQQRLSEPGVDPRIKKRVYFYLPAEGGIPQPEIGLGSHVYEADLSNLYDPESMPAVKGQGNALESAILDAGYRGYINREQGTAVVLNEDVPVQYQGTRDGKVVVPRRIQRLEPKIATREERGESVRKADQVISLKAKEAAQAAAPSFRMEYGEARVKTREKDAANAALEAAGSQFRFSRPLKAMTVQEALDMARTGQPAYTLGDAVERGQWAEAYRLAKNQQQRQQLFGRLGDWLIETFADAMIPVKRWIDALPLSGSLKQRLSGDLYRAAALRSTMQKELKQQFTEPMFRAIEAAAKSSKLTSDQVKMLAGYWMSAKYAPKANAWLITKDRTALIAAQQSGDPTAIAEAQKSLNDRLADVNGVIGATRARGVAGGFNNAEAAQMVADVESKISRQLLDEISSHVYGMMAWKRARDIRSGKVSQTAVNSWPNHRDYVPLTGDPRWSPESDDVFSTGGALNQEADKAINGRKDSVADDAIDAAFTAVVKSVNFSAMQDFKRSLARAYNEAAAQGVDIGLKREPVTGIIRPGDDVVIHRDTYTAPNGLQSSQAVAYRFDDKAVIGALKKENIETTNALLSTVSTPTRWYGRLVTQFMPMFAPINLVRDVWERSELVRTRKLLDRNGQQIDTDRVARAAIAETINPRLWKASFASNFNRAGQSPERADLEEMIRLGGSSVWGDYLARNSGDLEAELRQSFGKTAAVGRLTNTAVESYNNTFEMIAPLSIYRALKAQGMEAKDAAAATLDLMNFKKRGSAMPAIRALYVFAQPAATSGYNLMQYLSTAKGKKRFAAQLLIGTALYAFLRGMWGDDEDDEELGNKLDNLSNFTVERSIPIPIGDRVVKIPVGFGAPQLAWSASGILNRWQSGRYDTADALGELAKGWVKSVSPVAPSDIELAKRPANWLMMTFTPTVLRPLTSIASDQTAFGQPLTPVFKSADKFRSEQARRTTPRAYTEVAKEIREMTGVDLYPDHIKALADGYLIGPMREITSSLIENPSKEQRGEKGRMPLVASIVDNVNDRQILNSVYYRTRQDLEDANREYESRLRDGTLAGWLDGEKFQKVQAYKRMELVERKMGSLRGVLTKQRDRMDADVYADRLQEIETRVDEERRKALVAAVQMR